MGQILWPPCPPDGYTGFLTPEMKRNCPGTVQQTPTATISKDTVCDRWCGKWDTKEKAISSLFNLYRRQTGKILRWYINWEGYLEWFEIGERENIERISYKDHKINSFEVTEDATNIINDITGTYGEGDEAGTVNVKNTASITKYGLCIEDGIQDICMNQTQMTAYLTKQLTYRSVPIYSATVELAGFYLIEPSKQIIFPDDIYYSTKIWTVVDWKFKDDEGAPVTILNLTTDETVISLPNEFEIIRSTAQNEVQKALPEAAVVISVVGDTHLLVSKESDGSKSIVRSLSTVND